VVDTVARAALETVWPVRLSARDPLSFEPADVGSMLRSGEPRGIILDAAGCVAELLDQIRGANEQVAAEPLDDAKQR